MYAVNFSFGSMSEVDTSRIVLPGDILGDINSGFMLGHGILARKSDGKMIATVRGFVTRIGQLLTITPLGSAYRPNIGDIVIGRIEQIQQKRWKVHIGSAVLASLDLSAIDLGKDGMRRKTTADERNMRKYYDIGDLVCGEVAQVGDAGIKLHTRTRFPRRMDNGIAVEVPSRLVKRVPEHLTEVELNGSKFSIIYGLNGVIWISPLGEHEDFEGLLRIKNCFILMGTCEKIICSEGLCDVFQKTSGLPIHAVLSEDAEKLLS